MNTRRTALAAVVAASTLLAATLPGNSDPQASAAPEAPAAASTTAPTTPPPTPIAEVLGRGTTSEPYLLVSAQKRDFVARRVIIPPGGETPWHYHVGEQVVVQVEGVVERIDENCRTHTYRAGDAYIEPAGQRKVHKGVNRGTEPVVFYVTDMVPTGAPFGVNVPAPACAGQP